MPKFSDFSKKNLKEAEQPLQDLFNEVIKHYDCRVIEGHRPEIEQNRAYKMGRSKLPYPYSKHNLWPSLAVDVAPYPIDWNNTKRFYHFAGFVQGVANQMGIKVRWGGDWDSDKDLDDQTFMDLVHFELIVDDKKEEEKK